MPSLQHLPPNLDLEGTIVVLTHPRTGSSLLMQTLRLLGVEVVGEFCRAGLPAEANPKGFYEDLEILVHGLHAESLARDPARLRGRAVKLGLPGLARRHSASEWEVLMRRNTILLLPIRSPSESMPSEERLLRANPSLAPDSAKLLLSARDYLVSCGALAWRMASSPPPPRPACIDYQQAIDDPKEYVARVAACARVRPSEAQCAAAAANIDRRLYRVRSSEPGGSPLPTPRTELLEAIYQILRREETSKWQRLLEVMPSWTYGPTEQDTRDQTLGKFPPMAK